MTRDDIMLMALEAGGCAPDGDDFWELHEDVLVRFYAIAVAEEREACAVVCERLPETFKIAADEFGYKAEVPTAENYAAAIRMRSDT